MKTAIITVAFAAALALAGCGGSSPAYYLASNSGLVPLIKWQTPQNGQASGTITEDQPSGSAPNETLGRDQRGRGRDDQRQLGDTQAHGPGLPVRHLDQRHARQRRPDHQPSASSK
jgi:hypothetical protein